MQQEFLNYLRSEAKNHAKYVVILMIANSLLSLIQYLYSKKYKDNTDNFCILVIYGIPSICLTIAYFASNKNKLIVDIYGITTILSYTVALALAFITDLVPDSNDLIIRQVHLSLVLPFGIYGFLFNLQVVRDVTSRLVLYLISITIMTIAAS